VTVLAYDYLNGKDFASESVTFSSPMGGGIVSGRPVSRF